MLTLPKELKEAITALPDLEKDKLLFRLLKKDEKLVKRLFFELVDEDTVDEKREQKSAELLEVIQNFTKYFRQPLDVYFTLRSLGSEISSYVFTTKDKYGEVYLSLYFMRHLLENSNEKLKEFPLQNTYKIYIALLAKIFKTLLLMQKLHEDLRMDFAENLEAIAHQITDNPILMKTAISNGLDINWLSDNHIPEDLPAIYKQLRANGYLK